jgi:hypothetical protein
MASYSPHLNGIALMNAHKKQTTVNNPLQRRGLELRVSLESSPLERAG